MNKKVKNASVVQYGDYKFKSKLEMKAFNVLFEAGYNPTYETDSFHLWKGIKPDIPFYERHKARKTGLTFSKNSYSLIDIKYTPDFKIRHGEYTVFIEMKGKENDVFYIKKKMFIKYLEENFDGKAIYAVIKTIRELKEFLKILKEEYGT